MQVGVLALQGAFAAHATVLAELGMTARLVRTRDQLEGLRALILPGGESTTMSRLLVTSGLLEPLRQAIADGLAVFGTCAGMILLARTVLDGRPDQCGLGAIDIAVRRNGYGRQLDSFETDLDVEGLRGGPFHAVFIRAPVLTEVGPGVEVLARHEHVPVLARQGSVTVASFHPELSADSRLHAQFLQEVG